MNSSSKIAKEATISFAGMTFGQSMRYVFTALLARIVGAEYLGIYSIANSITRIFEVFAKAGLDTGIMRFVSIRNIDTEKGEIKNVIQSAIKMSMGFSIVLFILQIALAGFIVRTFYHGNTTLTSVLILFAFSLPFSTFVQVSGSATQGFKLMKYKVFVAQMLVPVLLVISMILSYYFLDKSLIITVPIILSSFIGSIVLYYYLKKLAQVNLADIFASKTDFNLLRFSLPLLFVTILGTLMHWTDILMIGYFMDEKSVGLYLPAVRTSGLIRSVMLAFIGIFSPMFSELFGKSDIVGMKNMYKLVVRWILSLAIPISIVFFVYAKKVMLIFGGQFIEGSDVLIILTSAILVRSLLGPGGTVLTMSGHTNINLINALIVTSLNIVLNIILIPIYGINGAAIATFTSTLIIGIIRLVETQMIVHLNPFGLKLLKPIIAGIGAAMVGIAIKPFLLPIHTILTLLIAASVIFLTFIFILWIVRFDDDDKSIIAGLLMIKNKNK